MILFVLFSPDDSQEKVLSVVTKDLLSPDVSTAAPVIPTATAAAAAAAAAAVAATGKGMRDAQSKRWTTCDWQTVNEMPIRDTFQPVPGSQTVWEKIGPGRLGHVPNPPPQSCSVRFLFQLYFLSLHHLRGWDGQMLNSHWFRSYYC